MPTFIEMDFNSYSLGFTKLEQLEALLLLLVDRNTEPLPTRSSPTNLFNLAHDLALDARCALDVSS